MSQLPRSRPRRLRTIQGRAFREFLAVGLMALLFLSPLSFSASASQPSGSQISGGTAGSLKSLQGKIDGFIVEMINGEAVCRAAHAEELSYLMAPADASRAPIIVGPARNQDVPQNYSVAKNGENITIGSGGLTIVLNSLSQLQGDANRAQVEAAVVQAAQFWTNKIKSPVTVNIDIDYGFNTPNGTPFPSANILASTGSTPIAIDYPNLRGQLIASASSPTEAALYNSLPASVVPTDVGDRGVAEVKSSVARALGIIPAGSAVIDATIGFNKKFPYDFNHGNTINFGQTDFVAVATHEIGHALGFSSGNGEGSVPRPSTLDLFRFRPGTAAGAFTTAQRILKTGGNQVFYTGKTYTVAGLGTTELGFSTGGPDPTNPQNTPDGSGSQSSHWLGDEITGKFIGIMDPTINAGVKEEPTDNDYAALELIGWDLIGGAPIPPPPPAPPQPGNDNFANAQTISGCSGSVAGTSLGATKETGEPNHDPTDSSAGSPKHTVWYQWQAPSSGSATITTDGSDFDTILAVYTGTNFGSLTQITFNDDVDSGVIRTSTVTFDATAGTTYKIAIDGWDGDSGTIKLNWTESNCPAKTNQTITFGALSTKTFGDAPFTISATASSGLPVSFSVFSGPATISGNTVTLTGAGTVTIRASQAGDATHNAAPDVDQSFVVGKATPVITWNNPASITFGTALSSTQLNATANTPGTFKYTPPAGTVPAVGGNLLTVDFTPTDTTNYTPATKSVQLTVNPANATVSFSSATYTVGEGAGNIAIVVTRTDPNTVANVSYATSDTAGLTECKQANGVASSRCDYANTVGTLIFQPGEASKTFFVPIVDDGYVEGPENFTVTLSNPGAVSLGAITTATVTITDNDATTSNPIVGVPFFVRQQYIDFLGREPDAGGFAGWQNILNNCTPGDTSCDRIAVSSGFFRSPEFQDRGSFIFRFYSAALGRNPSYAEFMPDLAKVSGFLSDAQLEANKQAFVQEFMTRPEYVNRYGSLSNAAFVDTLVQTSGLTSHPLRDAWVGLLNTQSATRAQVLRAFTESLEVYQKFYNQVFVVMQYFGYLRRDPDASYLTWIQTMNSNGGDFRAMINGFMNSNEYVLRFGP